MQHRTFHPDSGQKGSGAPVGKDMHISNFILFLNVIPSISLAMSKTVSLLNGCHCSHSLERLHTTSLVPVLDL